MLKKHHYKHIFIDILNLVTHAIANSSLFEDIKKESCANVNYVKTNINEHANKFTSHLVEFPFH